MKGDRDPALSIVHRLIMGRYTSLQYFPPEEHEEMAAALTEEVRKILATDGPRAFESPRSAAIAHEVGHAIVSVHDDVQVEKIAVWKAPGGGEYEWAGVTTKKGRSFFIGPDTPIAKALSHACFVIAGEVGEAILAPNEYRAGTALDEVIYTQRIVYALAHRVKMEEADLWEQIRKRSWNIISQNEAVGRKLISRLDRTETLQRRALTDALDRVRQIPDDWQWLPSGQQLTGRGPP